LNFWQLVWSDYEASIVEKFEPPGRAKALFLPRLLLNPSLQLALLVRLAQKGPSVLLNLIRFLQVTVFSSEIWGFKGENGIVLGPGIFFPHPFNIIIGFGTQIGAGVTIYNNTNIGGDRHKPPRGTVAYAARLGDRCVIYAYSAIQGAYDIGQDAVVGIHVVVDEQVPPGALKTIRRLRLRDDWPGEERRHWDLRLQ
jgi:serine acetyltransferase